MVLLFVSFMIFVTGCTNNNNDNGSNESDTKSVRVGFVTSETGLGDQAFNDAIHSGTKKAETALDNVKLTVIEPGDAAKLETSVRSLAREGNDLIIAGAASLGDAVLVVAKEFPDTFFVIIDGDIDDYDNVQSIKANEEEAAYLTGAFAQLYAGEGNKIGFIGGMDIQVIKKFEVGFVEGAKAVGGTEADVLISYTGVFNDPALGKQTAEAQHSNGATVIFAAAGACNLGMFEAAENLEFTALGAATGQFDKSDAIVASHVKSVDDLAESVITRFANGEKLTNGIVKYGLKEMGVDFRYNPQNPENNIEISQEIIDKIEALKQQIINGDINVASFIE